jgi:hypothetical protein
LTDKNKYGKNIKNLIVGSLKRGRIMDNNLQGEASGGNNKSVARLEVKEGKIFYYAHVLDIISGRPLRSRVAVDENNRLLMKKGNDIALMDEMGQEILHEIAYASPLIRGHNPLEKFIIVMIKI